MRADYRKLTHISEIFGTKVDLISVEYRLFVNTEILMQTARDCFKWAINDNQVARERRFIIVVDYSELKIHDFTVI